MIEPTEDEDFEVEMVQRIAMPILDNRGVAAQDTSVMRIHGSSGWLAL
jgi:hypothetical protein